MIRRPPRSTQSRSSAASDVYKRQQEDRLSAFPKDYISWDQSDARWILGLQWLAAQIYPQAFPNYEVTTSARDFFQQWYGLDATKFDQYIAPRLETGS